MKKKYLVEALAAFEDDDHIMIGDDALSWVPKITKICGGRIPYMVYYCIRNKGHTGRCYCTCKDVDFDAEIFD
jgi:hypothetical protein